MSRKRKFNSHRPGALRAMPNLNDRPTQPFGAAIIPSWRMEANGDATSIHLYGAIGGWFGGVDAAEIVPQIRAITTPTINLFVNSPGGDVYDAIAIRNALRTHAARVVVTVDGMAASAASFIACAGDEVIMGSNAELMIHDAWTIAMGNAEDMRTVAGDLDRISDNIAGMYAAKAGGTDASWRKTMKAETWYSADEAVAAGLADRTDTEAAASAAPFDLSVFAYAGRAAAPAPSTAFPTAALAPHHREESEETEMNRAQLAAALAAGTITQEVHDEMLASIVAFEAAVTPSTPVVPASADPAIAAELEAGPQSQTRQPAIATARSSAAMSLPEFSRHMADAYNTMDNVLTPLQRVQAALSDVVPADDAGQAFINREDFIGEAWRAADEDRPWIDAIGQPAQLTHYKGKTWRWGILDEDEVEGPGAPEVDEYAGNKTDVPSNEVGTLEQIFTAFGIAGAWDIDRRFFDFEEPGFWESFMKAASSSYKRKSNVAIRTRVLALAVDAATINGADVDETTAGTGISLVLKQLRRDIKKVPGGRGNRLFLGDYLYDAIEDLKLDDMPLWLRNATIGLGEEDGRATIGTGLVVVNDPALTAKQAVIFDNRALQVKERTPFWIKAENIPKGGVDAGVFSYLRLDDHDDRVVLKRDYA